MQINILAHLYFMFGIIIFMLNEAIFGSAGFFGYLFFYFSLIIIAVSLGSIVFNLFKKPQK